MYPYHGTERLTKNALLLPNEVCEFADKCADCSGKNKRRINDFSCGLRRGLLIADGYKVLWGDGLT